MQLLKNNFKLFPDQIENARSLSTKKRALFVDSTGSGKTISVLYAYAYRLSGGVLNFLFVLAPKNAHDKEVWKTQINRFTNLRCISFEHLKKQLAAGRSLSNALAEVDVLYAKLTTLKTDLSLCSEILRLKGRALTVIDEVHAFKTKSSALTTSGSIVLKHSFAVWGITATDFSVGPMDVYNIVDFIYPGKLGTQKEFVLKFCLWSEKVIGRYYNGKLKKARSVVGLSSPEGLKHALSDMMVLGTRYPKANIHFIQYEMSSRERDLYSRVAGGFMLKGDDSSESWIREVLRRGESDVSEIKSIKDVERHSARYIYLQSVVDGSLEQDGTFGTSSSVKSSKYVEVITDLARKGESVLMYFDYYTSMDNFKAQLEAAEIKDINGRPIKILENSERVRQKKGFVTSSLVKYNTYIILCSRASSESDNYPFIKHVIFYSNPTTPITYLQMAGRITRRDTEFEGDLHIWIPVSDNIDKYKLVRIGYKLSQMQGICYNLTEIFPKEFLQTLDDASQIENAKKNLLWRK